MTKKLYGFTSSTFTRVHAAHPRCDRAATQMAESGATCAPTNMQEGRYAKAGRMTYGTM